MSRSGKISVALPLQQISQMRRLVDAGEFGSSAAVIREAVRQWLQRRALHAGPLGVTRLHHTLEAQSVLEPSERVELLFDAGDAKA